MVLTASNVMGSGVVNNGGQIENIIIGILTGIISSILVTTWFRFVDSRREAKAYFRSVARYVRILAKTFNINEIDMEEQMNKIYDFLLDGDKPICYKWTFLSQKERILKKEFEDERLNLFFCSTGLIRCYDDISKGDESAQIYEDKKVIEEEFRSHWRKLIECQGTAMDYCS